MSSGFYRSATRDALHKRATILAAIREFFATRGVLEVETPALSRAPGTDPAIESISATLRGHNADYYLHTSPEFAMKRLLAAGSGDIYQLCRVFRDEELGRWHQPEFALLEWYRLGMDDEQLMTEVADVIAAAFGSVGRGPLPTTRLRYNDAWHAALGVMPEAPPAEVAARLVARGVDVPRNLTASGLVDLAFVTTVAPSFDRHALTFLFDYPANQAALARLKPTAPPVAARFEVFCGELELANGFHELSDAVEQRRRFEHEREVRRRNGQSVAPLDEDLLAALTKGLPNCAGVALGVDRLVALALGASNLAAALAFAHASVNSPTA